jgi:hypothetical protein
VVGSFAIASHRGAGDRLRVVQVGLEEVGGDADVRERVDGGLAPLATRWPALSLRNFSASPSPSAEEPASAKAAPQAVRNSTLTPSLAA